MDLLGGGTVEGLLGIGPGVPSPGGASTAANAVTASETAEGTPNSGCVVLLSHIFDNIIFALRDHSMGPKPLLAEFLVHVIRAALELPEGTGRGLCLSSARAISQVVRGRMRPCEQLSELSELEAAVA